MRSENCTFSILWIFLIEKAPQNNYFQFTKFKVHFKGLIHNVDLEKISLSPQQKNVLELLAKGYKNAEITELTGLSLNTIRTHTKLAYKKLDVNNVMDAILQAKQLGILE
ncbi:MAG: response regulator transcription factor [Vallitaleaceae bacterium]|nr:response regulator transcription factor [Vallitaleaceae bacterium]